MSKTPHTSIKMGTDLCPGESLLLENNNGSNANPYIFTDLIMIPLPNTLHWAHIPT